MRVARRAGSGLAAIFGFNQQSLFVKSRNVFFEIKGRRTAISFKKKKQLYITSRSKHHHHNNKTHEQHTQHNSTPPHPGREAK
jgi:hypothetical protein